VYFDQSNGTETGLAPQHRQVKLQFRPARSMGAGITPSNGLTTRTTAWVEGKFYAVRATRHRMRAAKVLQSRPTSSA